MTIRSNETPERQKLLAWSGVDDVDLHAQHPSVSALVEGQAAARPTAIAVVDGSHTMTYAELDRSATALADRLVALGASERRVAVFLERGAPAIVSFLAILKARATYVPVDTSYPEGRVVAILEVADPVLVLTRVGLAAQVPLAGRILCVDGATEPYEAGERPPPLPTDAAYAIFTSGSTGRPKGVVVDHRALSNYVAAALECYGVHAGDRVLQAASLGFDLSLEEIVVTLCAGATLVIRSAAPIASIQSFLEECDDAELTVLSTTAALWHELTMRLADGAVTLPARLRMVILGADAARPDVLAVWQRETGGAVRLLNSYGLTETAIVATVWEATNEPLGPDYRALPIGKPLRNVSVYVLGEDGDLAPIGHAGEVCIGGLAVAREYLGDEELTRARFVPDPLLPGLRMYRTGDRGLYRESGELEFLGRSDYQLKVSGVRVELGEIEARLREIAGVVEGIVVAQTSAAGETELHAYLTTTGALCLTAVRMQLERSLPRATVPAHLSIVTSFPLTPAGKIDRRALANIAPRAARTDLVAPATPVEEAVARAVAEVLGVSELSILDRFAGVGGTSLSAVRAASLLGHRLQRPVRAQVFFETTSLRDAAARIGAAEASLVDALVRDATLAPEIRPSEQELALTTPALPRTILITGATGFYGTFVLADLLRDTSAHIVCLVRAASPVEGALRIAASLAKRKCDFSLELLASRITAVVGDLGEPRLGLGEETFTRLAGTIDTIVNVGARVNMVLPYDALRPMNVVAVSALLELATIGRPKVFHHVSTVEVLTDTDPLAPNALAERRAAESPARLHEGYGQSKWVAEKLVEAARGRGVQAFIHRPGRLMGHSQTGAYNEEDFLVRLLEVCAEASAAPVLDVTVDITPVDYASRALVKVVTSRPYGEAFHYVSPSPPRWAGLLALVKQLDVPLELLPQDRWCVRLRERAGKSARGELMLYLAGLSKAETEASIHGGHASTLTRRALGNAVVCPAIDVRLIDVYVRRLGLLARSAYRKKSVRPEGATP